MTKQTVLVVDDEKGVRQSFRMVLQDDYQVLSAATGMEAVKIFKRRDVDLILLDIRLPDADGLELLVRFKEIDASTEVIMVTAVREIQSAVRAIKSGAYEYIIKPFDVDDVRTLITRALEKRRLVKEVLYLREELARHHIFEEMVGQSEVMKDIFDLISQVADSDGTVLIQGESGTGKELVARAIHNLSFRKTLPLVVVNGAAIPSSLMESELFGHTKGAFTGATQMRVGKLELAKGGTVFLDDIDALDVNMQAKLLRMLQEKEFERVGSSKIIKTDARFVAASNKDLKALIEKGQFREDLYYRLNVFPVHLPPLRHRKSDIPLLVDHFLQILAKKTGKPRKHFSEGAMRVLTGYDWPGNVRELQNFVERIVTISKQPVIRAKDFSLSSGESQKIENLPLKKAVNLFEKDYIESVLHEVEWNRKNAAAKLGIHRNTLLSKMNELGIQDISKK